MNHCVPFYREFVCISLSSLSITFLSEIAALVGAWTLKLYVSNPNLFQSRSYLFFSQHTCVRLRKRIQEVRVEDPDKNIFTEIVMQTPENKNKQAIRLINWTWSKARRETSILVIKSNWWICRIGHYLHSKNITATKNII